MIPRRRLARDRDPESVGRVERGATRHSVARVRRRVTLRSPALRRSDDANERIPTFAGMTALMGVAR
jgi:hypothetical protein